MAGLFSQGWDALIKKGMKVFIETIWPIMKYLIDQSVLIPLAGMAGIAYGVHLGYLTGPEAVWPFTVIACVAVIVRFLSRYTKQRKGELK